MINHSCPLVTSTYLISSLGLFLLGGAEVLNQVVPIYLFIHVLCPRVIGSYFSACNSIDNHNRMRLSNLAIDNYWVEHSVYFRLATTVVLGMV